MRALAPLTGLTTFREELDRLFERPWAPRWPGFYVEPLADWMPKMDVAETADTVTVTLEVPGVDETEIGITLDDQMLVIKGEKKEDTRTVQERGPDRDDAEGARRQGGHHPREGGMSCGPLVTDWSSWWRCS
jgi:HSP20 family molecular chaperone IbpA